MRAFAFWRVKTSAVIGGSGGVTGELERQSTDIAEDPHLADQVIGEGEHRGARILESFAGRCDPEYLPLLGARV